MTQYGLIVALVALVLVGVLANIGDGLQVTFCKVEAGFNPGPTVTACVIRKGGQP